MANFVSSWQVLEEALLPFLANLPTSRLKLITMYIEKRRAEDHRSAAIASAAATNGGTPLCGLPRTKLGGEGGMDPADERAGTASSPATSFTPIR